MGLFYAVLPSPSPDEPHHDPEEGVLAYARTTMTNQVLLPTSGREASVILFPGERRLEDRRPSSAVEHPVPVDAQRIGANVERPAIRIDRSPSAVVVLKVEDPGRDEGAQAERMGQSRISMPSMR